MTRIIIGREDNITDYCVHTRAGDNIYSQRKRNKQREKTKRETKKERFLLDFAREIDLFDSTSAVPDWVFDLRDRLLQKIGPELRKICYALRDLGLDFKIKWPVEVDGKWKFADILFPRHGTVLMLTNAKALCGRPMWSMSDRAEFFKGRFRVVEVETLQELNHRILRKSNAGKAS